MKTKLIHRQGPGAPLGLYIHIPFCRRKCAYCDFYSLERADDDGLKDRYLAALLRQMTETAATVADPVDSVYIGGGTPTVFGADRLAKILDTVSKRFTISKHAEVTCEANPESTDKRLMKKLRRAGVNRVSFGVQSTCDEELKLLGRLHDFEGAKAAIESARAAKIDNISLDLMFGIEGQTPESWARTLQDAVALEPKHISAYGLKVEEGTPLARRFNVGEAFLPADDDQADMFDTACRVLSAAGYKHYEISNWAKPGYESRHNLRYWRLEPYCGFGAAAHSDCFGVRSAAPRDIEAYMTAVETDGEVFEEYDRIPDSERAFEFVMLGLRTAEGISKQKLIRTYRLDPDSATATLAELESAGLVENSPEAIRLTEKGFLLSNTLILRIFESLEPLRNPFAKERT